MAIINAASASQSHVEAAIALANAGDTVAVPSGTASWSGMDINKRINLYGAGVGSTIITLTGNNDITKQASGVVRVSGFQFLKTGGGNSSKGWTISGSWLSAQPVIFQGCDFNISDTGLFLLDVPGGVIIAQCNFVGEWDDSFIQPKTSDGQGSWDTADTFGVLDTDGTINHYVETCTFYGGTNQGIDADDYSRVVYRYNTLTYSSFNSHGMDTSAAGVRHYEIYENDFLYPPFGGSPPNDDVTNQGWMIWLRGGTGFIFNNAIAALTSAWWGDRDELKIAIRGAEDARPQGPCQDVSYPVPRQCGQNQNGTSYFTDPVRWYDNTGTLDVDAGWFWGNPCGFTFSDFWQENRDYVIGAAKPGYAPYTYPHPLLELQDGGSIISNAFVTGTLTVG